MVRLNLDPRTGGSCVQFMANKFVSIFLGYVQLVIYILGFLTLVFSPSLVSSIVPDASTTVLVFTGFYQLLYIMFIVLLLIGLHKDNRMFVKICYIFIAVNTLLMILYLFINLFVRPTQLGFIGFFSALFIIIIDTVFVFAVRSYYLVAYCNGSN